MTQGKQVEAVSVGLDPLEECGECGCYRVAHIEDDGELCCPSPGTRFTPRLASQSPLSVDEGRVEEAAQAVYEHHRFGTWWSEQGEKPSWVFWGNSDAQDMARDFARAALSATAPKAPLPEGSEELEKLVERLREESAALQRTAWGRLDGGQECSLSAILADEAADAIESLSHQLTEALKDRDYYANRYADKCGETIVLTAKIEEAAKVAEDTPWPKLATQLSEQFSADAQRKLCAEAIRALAKGG